MAQLLSHLPASGPLSPPPWISLMHLAGIPASASFYPNDLLSRLSTCLNHLFDYTLTLIGTLRSVLESTDVWREFLNLCRVFFVCFLTDGVNEDHSEEPEPEYCGDDGWKRCPGWRRCAVYWYVMLMCNSTDTDVMKLLGHNMQKGSFVFWVFNHFCWDALDP